MCEDIVKDSMNPLKSQSYPKTAKFILAAFVLLVAWGPSIMRSADKKTRSHITATSGRVQQRSDAEKKMKSSQSELERNAEMEKRVELESEQARKEIQDKLRGVEIAKQAALRVTLEREEREALVEIEKRLEAQKLQLSERKQAENVIKVRELADRDSRYDPNKIKVPNLGYDRSTKEDGYKRPSIWGSFSRVPKRLRASSGSISMPSKETYSGYLAFRVPPPLRFSDDIPPIKRPSVPALPEFSILAPGRGSLTVETHLSDEEARKLALMKQAVFELEQHTIISGNIDTAIPREIEERDRLLIEETEESFVRPEEVLIFFENERVGNNTRTIVPFSPAQPSQNPPAKSGASYNRN